MHHQGHYPGNAHDVNLTLALNIMLLILTLTLTLSPRPWSTPRTWYIGVRRPRQRG